jgi:mannose-6-phosphate isomerase-like protein (cupin superfamily)
MLGARIVRRGEGDIHDGVPWTFMATGSQTGNRFDFMVGPVEYLSGPPLHVHAAQDDTFYVLEGVLTVQAGDEVFDLGPGDFVCVPPGTPHTFDNIRRDQPVRVINIMTPGGSDEMIVRLGQPEDERTEADQEEIMKLADKHGVTVVGPPLGVKLGHVGRRR